MSNVIQFLERLGRDASLKESLGQIGDAQLPEELISELAEPDTRQLIGMLNSEKTLGCLVFPAKQDDDEEQEKEPDEKQPPGESKALGGLRAVVRASIASR